MVLVGKVTKLGIFFMASLHNTLKILPTPHRKQLPLNKGPEVTRITLTSDTKKAWNPYGTLCGSSTTATGSADIVFASITFTDDFLHISDGRYPSSSSEVVPGLVGTNTASEPNLPGPRSKMPFTFPPTSIFPFPGSGSACRSNLTIPVTFAMLSRMVPYTYLCFLNSHKTIIR
ncbi:hypothetical protein SADUNF_Sadunf16G0152300 [Salix dunnii]|uniref:Uncharacterized protein n=1 Tax=Salix dunnii TaxID=1413687 RepID=A0A835J8Y5_9ROSI|nr:hypothetical protein SADUNF_Sadunf16G0152300 [Salix dunnii]